MKQIFSTIFYLFFVSGCVSGTQLLSQVDQGMSTSQVEEIMGKRDAFSFAERDGHKYALYHYINRYCNWNQSWDKCDFFVIFKDDKVIETGAKDVRSANVGMQFMYIFQQP